MVLPIQLQPLSLRPLAYRILSKKHGLNIKSDALKTLADYVGRKFGIEWKAPKSQLLLDEVARLWKEHERGIFLDAEGLSDVLKEIETLEHKSRSSHHHVSIDSMIRSRADTVVDIEMSDEEPVAGTTSPPTSLTPPPMGETLDWKEHFQLINAFDQPLFRYNAITKTYEHQKSEHSKFSSATVDTNIVLAQSRYNIVKDKVMRNESFESGTFSAFSSIDQVEKNNVISMIKNLLGRNNQRFLLLGMLTQLNGLWHLQDTSDKIQLNLDQCEPNDGSYYVSGNILLCEGIYSAGTFYVNSMAHPPAERRADTLDAIGNIDLLGVHTNMRIDKELQTRLKLLEREHEHKIIILGGDIFLDNLRTLDALGKLFLKLSEEENTPISIIFNGSFASTPKSFAEYKSLFDSLASVLEGYPVIHGNISLVFVPGENDHWQSPVWPKQSIPKLFGNRLTRMARSVEWVSNPTRMIYLSQEIVIARDDVGSRMRRHSIRFPHKGEQSTESEIDRIEQLPPRVSEARKLVKTLLDQGHLSPFTKNLKPTVWHLDHTLQLCPLPQVLILCDTSAPQFDVTYNGCKCLNPGVFVQKRRLNYIEYTLNSRRAEMKELYF